MITEDQGTKHDNEKTRLDLLPVEALEEIGKVLTFGAKKYDAQNWRKGFHWSRVHAALLRHLAAWARGENYDAESKLLHLAHAGCCLLFLLTFQVLHIGVDDRWLQEAPKKEERP